MFLYDSIETTIANGVTNTAIGFTTSHNVQQKCYYLAITNDDNENAISVRLHAVGNDAITIRARETLTLSNIAIDGIWMTNASGATVPYRAQIWGD
jgi:hypothetical protein